MSEENSASHLENVRENELKRLRLKVIEAIRFSEHYWMIFKERTFGIATILDLTYKKIYIEILFFTNFDVMKLGIPLLKIYTPSETRFDFSEVIVDPEFDEDGLISPKKIIARVNVLIEKELNYHLSILNKEIQLVNEYFENYSIKNNPNNRKIRIYYPDTEIALKLNLNLENYPIMPKISDKNQIIVEKFVKTYREKIWELLRAKIRGETKKIADEKHLKKTDFLIDTEIINDWDKIMKMWDKEKYPHIFELIIVILNLKKESQHLIFNNVSITNSITNFNLKMHRGQTLGIYYENDKKDNQFISNFFKVIDGSQIDFSGEIFLFGKYIKLAAKEALEKNVIISHELDEKLIKMTVKKAIRHNIDIKPKWKIRKRLLDKSTTSSGFLSKVDEIISLPPKYKTKKNFVNSTLEITGLLNKKKEKLSNLTPVEKLIFSLSRALLKSAEIIMFTIPQDKFQKVKIEQFNRYMNNIKRRFHVIIIIHGEKEIVSQCDQILTVVGNSVELGSINEYISKIPHAGDIITIELNNPNEKLLNEIFNIESVIFLTERINEKYTIFTKEDPDVVIQKIIQLAGPYLYSFNKRKANYGEYLEYLKLQI